MGERTHYEPGTFCWVGLATSDPAAAEQFYTGLFGWEAEQLSAGEAGRYTMLRRGAQDVAILYRQQPEARAAGAPPHWTSYISVVDADATAARAGELGGAAVFREPFDVLDAGRVAAISDPAGAVVSLWQPRSGSAPRSSTMSARCAGTSLRRPTSSGPRRSSARCSIGGTRPTRAATRRSGTRPPEWRHTRSDGAGARDSTELASLLHGREQRRRRPTGGAPGRAHDTADHRDPHRPHRRDRRPTASGVRGLRGRDHPVTERTLQRRRRPPAPRLQLHARSGSAPSSLDSSGVFSNLLCRLLPSRFSH